MEQIFAKFDVERRKSKAFEVELETQEALNVKLKREYDLLKLRMMDEAFFHTTASGFLSSMLWKASAKDENTRTMMASGKLDIFYSTTSEELGHFVDAFRYGIPEPRSDLAQLPYALSGCIANMASTTDGASNIINNLHGKNFLKKVLKVLPYIPQGSGDKLLWVLLLFLNNMSEKGYLTLKKEPVVLNVLIATVSRRRVIQELTPLALRMIEFVTSNMTNKEYIMWKKLIKNEMIELLARSERSEIHTPALKILQHFTTAHRKYQGPSRSHSH